MSRETFLKRVREAAVAGRAHRVHPCGELPDDVGYIGGGDDLCARMASEVEEVGGTAHLVDDLAGAQQALRGLLKQYGVTRALCWQHPLLDRLGLDELLTSEHVEQISHATLAALDQDAQRSQMISADLGISSVTHAIAETGTLSVASQPGQERLASLLPPVHVAVITSDQILPDLLDLFTRLEESGPESLPSNLTLITGPSKTGDIELQLTTGVHGPGKWHVIVVR
jgi:L-lactate dehydrogenase complex protein LldG